MAAGSFNVTGALPAKMNQGVAPAASVEMETSCGSLRLLHVI